MSIRSVQRSDAPAWERMRQALWPSDPGDHAREIEEYFNGTLFEPVEVLIALDEAGSAVGFAELSIRTYAEGCYSGHVAYLEGWYVEEAMRRRGIGTALVEAAQDWGRANGCTEFASDAELNNDVSAAAHLRLGFEETDRLICFRKDL